MARGALGAVMRHLRCGYAALTHGYCVDYEAIVGSRLAATYQACGVIAKHHRVEDTMMFMTVGDGLVVVNPKFSLGEA